MASDSSSSDGTEESSSAEMEESSSSEEEDSLPGTADVSSADGTSSIPSEGAEDDSSEDVTDESAASSDDEEEDTEESDDAEAASDDEASEISASEAASATEGESEDSEEPSDSSADVAESSEEADSDEDEDATESEVASDSEVPSESEQSHTTDPASDTEGGSESQEPSGTEVSTTESEEASVTEVESESEASADASDVDESSSVDEVTESEAASETEVSVSESEVEDEDTTEDSNGGSDTEVSASEELGDSEAADSGSEVDSAVSESEGVSESEEAGSDTEESISEEEVSASEVESDVEADEASESEVASGTGEASESETVGDSEEGSSSERLESSSESASASEAGSDAEEESVSEIKSDSEDENDADESAGTSESDTVSASEEQSESGSVLAEKSDNDESSAAGADEEVELEGGSASSTVEASENASVNSDDDARDHSLSEQNSASEKADSSGSAAVETRLSAGVHRQDERSVQTGTSESASVQTEVSPLVRKSTIGRVLPTQIPNIDSCSDSEPSVDGNDEELRGGEESQTNSNSGHDSRLRDEPERIQSDLDVAGNEGQIAVAAKQIDGFDKHQNPEPSAAHSSPLSDSVEKASCNAESFVNKQAKTDPSPLMSKLEGQEDGVKEDHQDMLDKIDVMSVGEMSALTTDTTAIKRRARYAAENSSAGQPHVPYEANVPSSGALLPGNTGDDPAVVSSDVNGAFFDVTASGEPLGGHEENGVIHDRSKNARTRPEANNSDEAGGGEKPRLFRKKSGILRFIQRGISSVRPSYRRNVGEGEAKSLTHAVDDASLGSPHGDDVMDLEPIETIDEDDEEEYQERPETAVVVPQRLPAIDFETSSIRDDPSESPSVADSLTESAFRNTTEKGSNPQANLPQRQSKLTRDASDGTHNSGKGTKRFGFFPRPNLRRKYSTVSDDSQSEATNDHDCPSVHFDNVPEASFHPDNQRSASKRSFAPSDQTDFAAFPPSREVSAEPSFPTARSSTTNSAPFFPAFPQLPRPSDADETDTISWSNDFPAPTRQRPPQSQEIHTHEDGLVDDSPMSAENLSPPEFQSEQTFQLTGDSASTLHVESQSIDDSHSSNDEVSHSSGGQQLMGDTASQSVEDSTHSFDDESQPSGVEDNSASNFESHSSEEASHSADDANSTIGSQPGSADEFAASDPDEGSAGSFEGSGELEAEESKASRAADSRMLSITKDSGGLRNDSDNIDSSSNEVPAEEDECSQSEGSSTNENEVLVDFMQMSDLISVSTAQDRELQAIEQMTAHVSEAEEVDSTMDNLFVGFTVEEALHTDNVLAFPQTEETRHVGHPEAPATSVSSSSSPETFQERLSDGDLRNSTATTDYLKYSEKGGKQDNADPTTDSNANVGDEKSIVIDFEDGEDNVEQSQLHAVDPLSNRVPDEAELETQLELKPRSSLLQLPQESFLTKASQDSSNTGQSKESKGRVRDAFARLGLSRNSPKKLDNDCSGSHDGDHHPSLSPPSSPASPLRNLAEKARQRLSAVKHAVPSLPSPASSTASRTLAESAQQELSTRNHIILSAETETEEAMAYDVEELVENNAAGYIPARTEQAGVNQTSSESSGSIGFDEDGVSVALFHESADIPDDYTYSKESLDIKATSGHEAQKQSDQSACWNMNNSADVSVASGASGPTDEERDIERGKKNWPFRRRGNRRPDKDIGALHMEIDVVENVLPQSAPPASPRPDISLDDDPCQSESKNIPPQELNRDPNDIDGSGDEECAVQIRSARTKNAVVENSASSGQVELSVPRGDDASPALKPPQHGKKRRKNRGRGKSRKECCTTIAIVLLLVLCGIGCGIIASVLLRRPNSSSTSAPPISPEPTAPATTPTPAAVATEPSGAPARGQVQYEMICSKMEDCSRLVDAGSPTARAFDWLIDPTHNPDLQSLSDSKAITRFALATIFYSTNGESWVNKSNWLSAQDECTWFSSSMLFPCDPSGLLISLDIENNNLKGTMPPEIGLLTNLQVLRLRSPSTTIPSLMGSIPTSIGLLTRLTKIEISGNSLTGFIPTTVGRLVQLKSLNLSSNGLEGDIPYQFDALSKLSHLNLSHNTFSGVFPPELLRSAIGIEELILNDNRITTVPDEIANLQKLRIIDVSQNQISRFPIGLTRLGQIQSLDMSSNDIDGTLPSEIGSMQSLSALTLSHNKLNGTIPSSLGNLLNLHEVVDLGHNTLTGTIPLHVGQLGRLKKLYLNSNRLSGTIPSELVRLNQINAIRLDSNLLTGQVPILLCDLYSFTNPISYADCGELKGGQDCFTYCCSEEAGCRCRFESSTSADEFLRCLG